MNGLNKTDKAIGAKIKVIGVGGGGGNMIDHMAKQGLSNAIELISANTDAQALDASEAKIKIQLGERKTKGLGAGMKPEIGKEAALESYDDIKESLEHSDIVFIAAGFGGGTGTGAAPIVAQAAKEVGALTVSVVTKPFMFEGRKRLRLAEAGLEELRKESDSIVIIPNEKLQAIVDKNLGIKESFKMVDDILSRAVGGISGVLLSYGQNDINLDFADVQTVMSHRGMALMGVGESVGDNSAIEAIKSAIESPLLDNMSINGAMGVLVHFYINPDFPLSQITEAMNIVYDSVDEDGDVIFGTTTDETMSKDEVKITIVATGFESEDDLQLSESKQKNRGLNIIDKNDELTRERMERIRKVSGGYEGDGDYLDVPTFLRKQMD